MTPTIITGDKKDYSLKINWILRDGVVCRAELYQRGVVVETFCWAIMNPMKWSLWEGIIRKYVK